jgi:isoprenylcysteine carboxyl methyltransferase (ICMT) family protein YpbQ
MVNSDYSSCDTSCIFSKKILALTKVKVHKVGPFPFPFRVKNKPYYGNNTIFERVFIMLEMAAFAVVFVTCQVASMLILMSVFMSDKWLEKYTKKMYKLSMKLIEDGIEEVEEEQL